MTRETRRTRKPRVVLWGMFGRRENWMIQFPLIDRVLAEHPNITFDVWNMARNEDDDSFVRGIAGDRITVRNDFYHYGPENAHLADWEIWRHYGGSEYKDCLFVKIDDDVIFLQSDRFGAFLAAIEANPRSVISANVINNEACTALEPGLWELVAPMLGGMSRPQPHWWRSVPWLTAERVRLKDLDHSVLFAQMAHSYFFAHHQAMLDQSVEVAPTEHYLSLHLIGYDWSVAREIAEKIGPNAVSDGGGAAEETLAAQFPCFVVRGFAAAHLTFGAQEHAGNVAYGVEGQAWLVSRWRERYAELGRDYLSSIALMPS